MVWVALSNGSGQVVKGIRLSDGINEYEVASSKRLGINRYEMTMTDGSTWTNHQIKKWSLVGRFHTPEEMAAMFNRKLDPDANLPRPQRESFWKMKSKPGTHNYKQKKRLMQDPYYINKFGHLFGETISEEL
jgi:hypothetical protein